MSAFAQIHAAKVEAQHDASGFTQTARDPINHLVVHGAAEQRMRMADERGFDGIAVFRLFEQAFQPAVGPGNKLRFDTARHQLVRKFVNWMSMPKSEPLR